jgi:proteasome lid subunit RPN8/RPN11
MEPEIEFGEVRSERPRVDLRPDRDDSVAVRACGLPKPGQLPIFVDLDVMRDMEAHAVTNTSVELGGVLLGYQAHDEEDQPFVVISESLRAEHYQATRGSFKFTHETWTEISRRRNRMHPKLQMVGWYHTHPGWGIFLSDMDLFICDNFFSRPLDVALVIDPRQQTRGWFQWNAKQQTEKLGGFFLTTHRHRSNELVFFGQIYSGEAMQNYDPRYSEPTPNRGETTVQLIERGGTPQWVGLGMLGVQGIVLLLLAWKILIADQGSGKLPADQQPVVANSMTAVATDAARADVYQEILQAMLAQNGISPDLPKMFADTKLENEQLDASIRSHISRIEQLESQLEQQTKLVTLLKADKETRDERIARLEAESARLLALNKPAVDAAKPAESNTEVGNWLSFDSIWTWIGMAMVVLLFLAGITWLLKSGTSRPRRRGSSPERQLDPDPLPEIEPKLKSIL